MTPIEALQNHLALCDELHQLAVEENRFLKQHQRTPDSAVLERKKSLLERLDSSLTALRGLNQETAARDPSRAELIEKSKAKILQILHLDRENEQLLLRFSLGVRPLRAETPPAPAAPSQVQRLYDRHS